jgi:photosystem II stability/assembly factor-like uncharacterized protein
MWNPESQENTFQKNWQCVATNHDGSVLIASIKGGTIWIKKNNVWNESIISNRQWSCVASNYDGDKLYACENGGDIWYYENSWINLTETDPLMTGKKWTGIACDYTGDIIFACSENQDISTGEIWYRIDDNWNTSLINANWSSIACDSTGDHVITCDNGGNIWTGIRYENDIQFYQANIAYQNWIDVAINSAGNFFVACASGGNIWKGHVQGDNIYWEDINNVQNWRSITMDASGQNIVACAYGNDIWSSRDNGDTWTSTNMSYKLWVSIASDSTGTYLIACEYGGKIWSNVYEPPPTPPTPIIDICFVKDTLVETDQGIVPIQKLIPRKHSLFKQNIIAITKTIHTDSHIVKVSAYAFGSYPTRDTYVSKNHKINGIQSFLEAQDYVNGTTVTLVPYDREPLYNVLCERPSFMKVHGMMAETLDPQSDIALYHKSKRYRRL